jgi:hypothetical protein
MNASLILLFNPFTLMKSSRLLRIFAFLFSLLGMGILSFAERYETVFVYTDDTPTMSNINAKLFLASNAVLSTQILNLRQGEIAYIFSSTTPFNPNSTTDYSFTPSSAFVPTVIIDSDGLDANTTLGSWNAETRIWGDGATLTNISSDPDSSILNTPIIGPAKIRIRIKPFSTRDNEGTRWDSGNGGNWDFRASEGSVTFRILGSEKELSKKFATVIPENAVTNVRVILEQSTDLINWTAASPGVFPPSTAKRFFRVRSEEE